MPSFERQRVPTKTAISSKTNFITKDEIFLKLLRKQKLKEFMTTKPVLQNIFNEILYKKEIKNKYQSQGMDGSH